MRVIAQSWPPSPWMVTPHVPLQAMSRTTNVGVTGRQFYLMAKKDKRMVHPAFWIQDHVRASLQFIATALCPSERMSE